MAEKIKINSDNNNTEPKNIQGFDEQPKKKDTTLADPYINRLGMFKDAINNKKDSSFIKGYALRHPSDVERAIGEGQFTKQQAIEYLDFRG